MMNVRVAFITNFITPYRVSFFSKMGKLPGIDLLVIHGEVKKETGRPAAEVGSDWDFDHQIVRNNEKKVGPFTIRWQSGAFPLLRSFRPDVVVVLGISGTLSNWMILIWGRLKRLRTLMWMCGWEAQKKTSLAYLFKRVLLKLFIKLPSEVLVYSSKAKEYMLELGIKEERCVICYNGIEIDGLLRDELEIKAQATEVRDRLNPENLPVFLYVGGILPQKRVDLLLRAFSKLRKKEKSVLWIIGDGPSMEEVKDLAQALRIPGVSFLGRIIDDVDPYFAAADFFVLPGIGGLGLNQAMFWNTPCICSEADGTEADLVFDGETGFRFLVGDEASLLSSLSRAMEVCQNTALHSHMVAKGRELIETRSNTDEMLKTYQAEFIKGK